MSTGQPLMREYKIREALRLEERVTRLLAEVSKARRQLISHVQEMSSGEQTELRRQMADKYEGK